MANRELATPHHLVITINRLWARCSPQSYANYLIRQSQQQLFYTTLNRISAISLMLISILLLAIMTDMVWQQMLYLAR